MKEKYKGTINILAEVHCPECDEIIHHHIDCPSCKRIRASTDNYMSLYENKPPYILTCDECNTKFQTNEKPYNPDTIWEEI